MAVDEVVFSEDDDDSNEDTEDEVTEDCRVRYRLTASLILVNNSATPEDMARSERYARPRL